MKRPVQPHPQEEAASASPTRNLVKSAPHRTVGGGRFPGLSPTDLTHESHNERHALLTLALCHDVTAIASQAGEEPYELNGRQRHHTPDFVVDAFVPGLRIEVKSITSLARPEAIEKYRAVAQGYRKRGIPFAFLVDAQLEEQPRFRTVKLLCRYVTSEIPQGVTEQAEIALQDGALPIAELMSRSKLQLVDVLTLIAKRRLCFDWLLPFDSKNTVVCLPGQPFGGLLLESILCASRFSDFLAQLALGRPPTDQRLLADAKTWRQLRRPLGPWQFVGGLDDEKDFLDRGSDQSFPIAPERRRDFAPGQGSFPARRADR